ncbi:MAG: HD domain-containing protein [Planctomycetes bacterium]|nr:HD domain-containing protein [Planctomycetota bacterium]
MHSAAPVSTAERARALQTRHALNTNTLQGYAAVANRVLLVPEVYSTPEAPFDPTCDLALGTRGGAAGLVPIFGSGSGNTTRVVALLVLRGPSLSCQSEEIARALAAQAGIALDAAKTFSRQRTELWETVCTLAAAAEHADSEAPAHVRRVGRYAEVLAQAHELPEERVNRIRFAAPLHDLGKIGIPPSILFKPGKLTDAEFKETQTHCERGKDLLDADLPLLHEASRIAWSHHERWDGTGYPQGLLGKAIPLSARIVAVVDVFDALTTKRSYKPALPVERSLAIVEQEAGRHFDPEVVAAFRGSFEQVLAIKASGTKGQSE